MTAQKGRQSAVRMAKGERTRARVVATAAPLFNQRGYAGTTVADLLIATGLEKGGLYRHFESKDELALAAFDYSIRAHGDHFRACIDAAPNNAVDKLVAFAEAFADIVVHPLMPGGCPLLNTATESDDSDGPLYPALRTRTRRAMKWLIRGVTQIIRAGVASSELSANIDAAREGSMLVALMEGAIMLSNLYADTAYVRHAVASIRARADALRPSRINALAVESAPSKRQRTR